MCGVVCQLNQMPADGIEPLFFAPTLKVRNRRHLPTCPQIFLLDIAPFFESQAHARNGTLPPGRPARLERVSGIPEGVPNRFPLVRWI